MKAINLKESITLQNISGEAFMLKGDGSLAPLHVGMNINSGTIIVLTDNGSISAIDKTGAPAELSYELVQDIPLPTTYEHVFSTRNHSAIHDSENSHNISGQKTASNSDVQKIHDAIVDGADPTKVHQPTAAGNESSSNWGVVTIDYDNDKMLAKAGFDTAYQPSSVKYPEDYSGQEAHKGIKASIVIDSISQDDVVTAAESHSKQTITGTVGDDVKAGDIVTVTLDGKTLGTATVENHNGKLTWSLDVDGKTLLQAGTDKVAASVTTTDDVGNTAIADTTHDYSIDVKASITINPITGDNIITQAEGHEKTLPITGTVGDDVQAGDKVVVTVNGHEYNTTVTADKTWSVNVTGDDILHADKATATVTTDYGIPHEATATASEHYDVQIDASIKITSIAGDGVVNKTESEGKVPVTGTVGKDVEPGDTVTVTIGDKTYTTTVTPNKTWTVDVDGSALVNNKGHDVHASVTANDGAGHSTTANDDKPYTVDTEINASITIDSISQDDVVTAAESHSKQTITGTVGDDVKAGDIVTVTLDGKTLGTATVENHNGKLTWSLDVDGKTLLQSGTDKVAASVTATDTAGNSVTADTTHDYSIDVKASITINPITGDDIITQAEGHEKTLPITGTVGDDVQAGDKVVVTVNGHEYNTTVTADKTWSVNVTGDDILHADKATATVTTDYGIPHEATATDVEDYVVQIDAGIQITAIAGDDVVNKAESTSSKVPVTGTVGKDVHEGDTVTVTIGDKHYTTTVTADKTWTVDVDGSALVNNKDHDVHASVTTSDDAGHEATATNDKPYTVDTEIKASITIDSISQDDVVTAAESHSKQTITGTVGDDVKAGDIVTVTLDGKTLGTATVENHNGKLTWSLDVDGKTLLQSGTDKVAASVTATDTAGNSVTADTTHDYSIDVKASITINPITGDNIITQVEGHEKTLPITGTVGDDVQVGDKVVVTVNGHEYNTTVTADKTWSVNVTGDDILHADKATATVTTDYGIPHEATATDVEDYVVQIEAGIQITSIAGDDVVNKTESEGKVPVTGVVGKDVQPGDTVTVTIGDKHYTTTVTADKTWTVDVDGSALVNNKGHDVHASVTTNDGAGHEATATNDKPYTVDTEINASITIDNVTADNVVNEKEAKETIALHGAVGGDVKVGDEVTINVDGHEYKTKVVEQDGKLGWTVDVEGSVLANASKDHITAQVTATDSAGNSATANAEHDYSVKTLDASITIDDVTCDNVINDEESKEVIPLHGSVGGGVKAGDEVTINVDGHEYKTKVVEQDGKLGWTVDVEGSVLANASKDHITAQVTATDSAGNSETATAEHDYSVKSLSASITIDNVTADNVINEKEAKETIALHGSVGGGVKAGDQVIITIDGHEYRTEAVEQDGKLGWSVDVDGSVLANAPKDHITAEVFTSDDAGNSAFATAEHDYSVKTLDASITIDNVTADNVINEKEAKETIALHGSVGGGVKAGDEVTINVDGHEYKTKVVEQDGKLGWTVDVKGSVLANVSKDHITAQVTATDSAGNSETATAEHDYSVKTLDASITIDNVATDNVLNADESKEGAKVSITGTVGGDVKAGDTVTLTVDGKEIGTAKVVDNGGKLEWTATDIDGHLLANASKDDVTASVSIKDAFGNTASATDNQTYEEKTLSAQVDITAVAGDNVLNADESKEGAKVSITGTVGGDVKAGDTVTLTVDGKEIGTAKVVDNGGKLEWTATDIDGHLLANASKDDVTASVSIKDAFGNTASATDNQTYEEKTLSAQVDITAVAGDNVLNADESKEGAKVSITGTVGGDVKAGDTVTLTVDGKEIGTAKVVDNGGKLEWTATDIDGHLLANASKDDVTASVSIKDAFGNTASATDNQTYEEKTLSAQVDITAVAGDNVLNADESKEGAKVSITGTVGGDVKAGDTVTLTVDGKEIGTAKVVDNGGKLEWTATDIDGHLLANASKDDVTASVSIKDAFGNTASATDNQTYEEKTLSAQVDITAVAGDNVLNADESKEGAKVSITGTVGGDVKAGDTVTLTVDGKEIGTAKVVDNGGKLEWTATDIDGHLLANASKDDVTASVSIKDAFGNTASATDNQTYQEKTLNVAVDITSIAGDNVLNATESKSTVAIKGTVGGDAKVGDSVRVTLDGKDLGIAKVVADHNGKLVWTLDVDGSTLAGASVKDVHASISISDSYGNTAAAESEDSYSTAKLDVSITIETINSGEPITAKEHDTNTPIKVTGTVGGDAKEGDTVKIHIGEHTVETKVITLDDGHLGYVTDVPGGMFEPDKNDGFSGDVTADITINDNYGNSASANDEKDFDTLGEVIIGGTSGDDLHGTGYNDLMIGDVYIESKDVSVNLVLDISGSMDMKEISSNNIHLNNGYTSGKLLLTDVNGEPHTFDFSSMTQLNDLLLSKYGNVWGGAFYESKLTFEFADGSKQIIDDLYKEVTFTPRIDSAKESINHIVENYGEKLSHSQLSNFKFSLITFASQVDATKEFHWDFDKNTLVAKDGQTIADYLTSVHPLTGPNSQTDYDTSLVAALNGFNNDSSDISNIVYFVTDGMDTIETHGKSFNKDWVISQTAASIDKYKPLIVPVAIGDTINNTPIAHNTLNEIASLGQDYKADNSGQSQVIISTNTADLDDAVNNSFDKIVGGNDSIHGGAGNDFIVGDTLNNQWLLEQYGSKYHHMEDLIKSGVTLEEVLFSVAAKDQGVDVDKLTTKDVYQFVMNHQDTLVTEGNNSSNGSDKMFGDEGQDILFGSGNNDILTGGTGDDLLFGQNGNDILVSDSGSDILFGGQGNDIFKLDVLSTNDKTVTTIKDFEKGDSIDVESILNSKNSVDDLLKHVSSANVEGKDVTITFDDKHQVELKNITEVYHDLGTSTSEIVTQLFNHDVFTNHH